jgi:hypothetical protein
MNKQVSVNQPGVMSKDEWSSRVECANEGVLRDTVMTDRCRPLK